MGRRTLGIGGAALVCALCIACGDDAVRPRAEIRDIFDEVAAVGETVVPWNQMTRSGESVPPGTYGARMTTQGFDSTAVFRIIADESDAGPLLRASNPKFGFGVWTGLEAYVVGEVVDVHFSIPEAAEVRVTIVSL